MNIHCFRKRKQITREMECRTCFFRRRCRAFQLWIQPELPFIFKMEGNNKSVFDLQNHISIALDTLYPSEYTQLKKMALKSLPDVEEMDNMTLIRLKMYEILTGKDRK
ncbi:conserved hypothetical protein [Desulfamplus magnetovallimortis]|uniref:Uncharacterized protein n=1 Tax=Desulfamplus magnetovallimortis TaxID=1246637 RepID=A0A1W1HGC4_9BACT|nr:hypothetical protein [Desulfamplus magnetovallimortis]SLM31529.1 conserved hypothetical protein [Desulfamplus magnetovallimortis]